MPYLSDGAILRGLARLEALAIETREAVDAAACNAARAKSIDMASAWARRLFPLVTAALHLFADARAMGYPDAKRHKRAASRLRDSIRDRAEDVVAQEWVARTGLHDVYPADHPAPPAFSLERVRAVGRGEVPPPLTAAETRDLFA